LVPVQSAAMGETDHKEVDPGLAELREMEGRKKRMKGKETKESGENTGSNNMWGKGGKECIHSQLGGEAEQAPTPGKELGKKGGGSGVTRERTWVTK